MIICSTRPDFVNFTEYSVKLLLLEHLFLPRSRFRERFLDRQNCLPLRLGNDMESIKQRDKILLADI